MHVAAAYVGAQQNQWPSVQGSYQTPKPRSQLENPWQVHGAHSPAHLQGQPQERLRELKVAVGGQLRVQEAQQAAQVGHLLLARHALNDLRGSATLNPIIQTLKRKLSRTCPGDRGRTEIIVRLSKEAPSAFTAWTAKVLYLGLSPGQPPPPPRPATPSITWAAGHAVAHAPC